LGGGLEKLLALLGCPTDPAIHQGGAAANTPPAAAAASYPSSQQQQQPDDDQQQQQQRRRLQRKVLALLQYVLAKHPMDGFAAAEFGVVPHLQQLLTDSNSDSDMRTATLSVLVQVVGTPQGWQWVKGHHPQLLPDLQKLLQKQQQQQQAGGDADEGYEEEEVQLLQQLVGELQAASPPAGASQGLSDHIDLDPYQVGGWVVNTVLTCCWC
jgi:hypothetical protein